MTSKHDLSQHANACPIHEYPAVRLEPLEARRLLSASPAVPHAGAPADDAGPTARLSAADVTAARGAHRFSVTYRDPDGVDASTLGRGDVVVTGPNGFRQIADFVRLTERGDGTPRKAIYRIDAPGPSFDQGDDGTYTVSLRNGEVRDAAGNFAAAGKIGTFDVDAPRFARPGGSFSGNTNGGSNGGSNTPGPTPAPFNATRSAFGAITPGFQITQPAFQVTQPAFQPGQFTAGGSGATAQDPFGGAVFNPF